MTVDSLSARYYVRAGLDPTVATEDDLDAMVRALLRSHRHLTPAERGEVAAAALSGWMTHRGSDFPAVMPWYRWMGGVQLEVTRG